MSGPVTCDFCAHTCSIAPDAHGLCGVRTNREGHLVTGTWGRIEAMASDPVEKKPLYHFLPGTATLSIALFGCNFRCTFCQNASLAHPSERESRGVSTRYMEPEEVVSIWRASGTPSIAFTYSEPTVWQDYLTAVARGVRARGGRTIMVTNGFFHPAATERLLEVIDAFNIDLKGDDAFYRDLCHARVAPVREAIGTVARRAHLEVTSMYLAARHSLEEMVETARFLESAGVSVWHISRFFPAFRMTDVPATTEEELQEVLERLRKESSIPFIYGGNSRQLEYQQTTCPGCDTLCIERRPGRVVTDRTRSGMCPHCGAPVYGVFDLAGG